MVTDDASSPDTLADFVNRLLRDRAEGRQRPLAAYLARYPGHVEAVAREYLSLMARAEAAEGPSRIGDYAIARELGRGGQAVVYLARDLRLPREVALKVLVETGLSASADALARFGREAAVVSRLAHPGICTVYETGVVEGRPFLAMQLVDGAPLSSHLERSAPGTTQAVALPRADGSTTADADAWTRNARVLEVLEATARALDAAHRAGVVHRDIKPSNILLRRDGTPVIVDFGLAYDDADQHATLTHSGMVFGTPAYMSPEQVRGDRARNGPRTDVYSLGVTAYEALCGVRPFTGATRESLFRAILEGRPRDPCRINGALPPEVRVVLATAMDVDPERRYETAAAFADDLQRVRTRQPIHAEPPSLRRRLVRWTQRNPLAAASLAALAVALGITVGVMVAMVSLRASEQRALERVDAAVLRDLRLEAEERLWPETPAMLARLETWCADAETLLRPRLVHWRERAPLPGEQDLAAEIGTFLGADGPLARVRARIAHIEALAAQTIGDSVAWARALAAVESSTRYASGAAITPTFGLVPLGLDPQSGLAEFWHARSGSAPRRGDDGMLRIGVDTGLVFVLVPAGTCTLGQQSIDPKAARYLPAAEPDESPVHRVELAAFLIAKHELTQGQWARLSGQRPSQFHAGIDLARRFALDDSHPLENVTWDDADLWLRRFGLALPTEAQWEYACRAGSEGPWWTGDDDAALVGCANLADKSLHDAYPDRPTEWVGHDDGFALHAPVGSLRANPFGLHHMHGNVAEWCADGPGSYGNPARPGDGFRAQPDSGYRVLRGGYFEQVPAKARSSYRTHVLADHADYWVGMRPVVIMGS